MKNLVYGLVVLAFLSIGSAAFAETKTKEERKPNAAQGFYGDVTVNIQRITDPNAKSDGNRDEYKEVRFVQIIDTVNKVVCYGPMFGQSVSCVPMGR